MANPTNVLTLHAMGAESGADEGTSVDIEAVRTAALIQLRVVAGVLPSVTIKTSADNATWQTAGTIAPSASLVEEVAFEGLSRYLLAAWPDGTEGTFEVTAVGHQLLAGRPDLYAKLAREICDETELKEPGIIARALIEASDVAVGPQGAFRDIDCLITCFGIAAGPLGEVELTLDFSQVPLAVRGAVASIAALLVLTRHGFVGGGYDEVIIAADQRARESLLAAGSKSSSTPAGVPQASTWRWAIPTARR